MNLDGKAAAVIDRDFVTPRATANKMDRYMAMRLIDQTVGRDAFQLLSERVADDETLLLSGSLVAGLGNHRSDLDFYVITDRRSSGSQIQMALAGERYLDCERLRTTPLRTLAVGVRNLVGAVSELAMTPLQDLDRYHRMCIAVPLGDGNQHEDLLACFDDATSCAAVRTWASLHAHANAARARIAGANGALRHAAVYAQDALLLALTSVLADRGDAYPSPKWAIEKARRTMGADSAEFAEIRDITEFHDDLASYVATSLAWVGANTVAPVTVPPSPPPAIADATRLVRHPLRGTLLVRGAGTVHTLLPEDEDAVRALLSGTSHAFAELRDRHLDMTAGEFACWLAAAGGDLGRGNPRLAGAAR